MQGVLIFIYNLFPFYYNLLLSFIKKFKTRYEATYYRKIEQYSLWFIPVQRRNKPDQVYLRSRYVMLCYNIMVNKCVAVGCKTNYDPPNKSKKTLNSNYDQDEKLVGIFHFPPHRMKI